MKDLIRKLTDLEKRLSEKHGPFVLYALMDRDDSPGMWDLVVASRWIDPDLDKGTQIISQGVLDALELSEVVKLSRIVTMSTTSDSVKKINRAFRTEHNPVEVVNTILFGMQVRHGVIITSHAKAK